MQSARLIYGDEALYGPGKTGPAVAEIASKPIAFNADVGPASIGGAALAESHPATTVRTLGAAKTVEDGLFAQAREQFSGFHLVDVPDLDAAPSGSRRCGTGPSRFAAYSGRVEGLLESGLRSARPAVRRTAVAWAAAVIGLAVSAPAEAATPVRCAAFVDVAVVATDRAEITAHRTVVARGGRIASIGPSTAAAPSACRRIDGRGRYLIPGLVDTHAHVFGYSRGGEGDPASEAAILRLLVANGVTTAVIMEGSPATLRLREAVKAGRVTGPTLYSAGLLIQGPNTGALPLRKTFATPQDVRTEVEAEKAAGYDFVKVHGAMPKETYAELLATARKVGLPVIGHVPDNLGIDAALGGGQIMIAHAESYLQTYFEFNRKLPTDPAEIDAMARDVAARTARAGVYVQPTLSVFRQIITQVGDPEPLLQRPEMRLMPPAAIRDWQADRNPYLRNWTFANIPQFRAQYRVMQRLVLALRDVGVPLLVGTDDMAPMQLPGFSMRDEMVQLQEAGLTPFEVLQAATLIPARFLRREKTAGRVAPGYDADLVLLAADPLEDVSNVFRQDGVMLHGRWFSEAELQHDLWKASP